jgi:hypothetical protein
VKLLYKPFSLAVTLLGQVAAGVVYRRLWRALTHEKETPRAMDQYRSWRQVLVASAIKGAIFGVVRAVSRRSGATGFASLTGTWPGRQSARREKQPSGLPVRKSH